MKRDLSQATANRALLNTQHGTVRFPLPKVDAEGRLSCEWCGVALRSRKNTSHYITHHRVRPALESELCTWRVVAE